MRRIGPLALLVLLGGCALPTPSDSGLADAGIEIPARWSAGEDAAGVVTSAWLEDLADPLLGELVDDALAGNLDLRAAAARLRAAAARARIAGAAALPQLDASGAATRRSAGSPGGERTTSDRFDLTLGASWELDVWRRIGDRTRAAGLDAAASEADLAAARLSLAANVARGWYDAVEATLQVELAEETARNFRDNLAVVQESFRAGLAGALDVRLERANVAAAEARLQARRVERDAAARRLEIVLGRYPGNRLQTARVLPHLGAVVPAGLPAGILARRPDLRASAVRLAAADARLDAARKNRLPTLLLTGSGGVTSDALRSLLDFDALLLTIAAELGAPLVRGGELAAERDLARAERDEALARYAQAVLVAFREVESALTAESLLEAQETALREAAEESRIAEELALERYRSGLTDIITWLEARRRAFDARSSLLSVSNQRLQNRIALHLALGGDFTAAGAGQ